jgi:hypothetical protein
MSHRRGAGASRMRRDRTIPGWYALTVVPVPRRRRAKANVNKRLAIFRGAERPESPEAPLALEILKVEPRRRGRGDIDHRRWGAGGQRFEEQIGQQEIPQVVRCEHQLKPVRAELPSALENRCAVHQDMESRVTAPELGRQMADGGLGGEIAQLRMDVGVPARLPQCPRDRLAFGLVPRGEYDGGSKVRQALRRRHADAPRRTRDQAYPCVHFLRHRLSPVSPSRATMLLNPGQMASRGG